MKNLLVLFLLALFLTAYGSEETAEPTEKTVVEEQKSQVNWKGEIASIASSDKTETEKHDEVYYLAKDYAAEISEEELNEFKDYIVNEFTSGKYLSDITNHEYMLENIFKSVVVERAIEDKTDPVKNFAFDYYQNIKYTYRGVDDVDSDEVKSNEEQMNKVLSEMK